MSLAVAGCRVDPKIRIPVARKPVAEVIPAGWPAPVYRFENNPVSGARFELGRALFYETKLSRDNTISCGTCHQQFAAFANADHDLSHGIGDLLGKRNSPALFNLTWHPSLMHDGGVNHIEVQAVSPITNPVEMDETINNVVTKLNDSPRYDSLFRKAFGSSDVTSERMLKALGQFMGLLYSYNAKYDKYKRGEIALSAEELSGLATFEAKCASCHQPPLFTDFEYRNNGLSVNPVLHDSGRALITLKQGDLYKFKTPSLRNIAVTAPYMHDGRYKTMEECIEHYASGIDNHTNLAPELEYGIHLTPVEKSNIISFLHTLTDHEFLNDARYGDPNFTDR